MGLVSGFGAVATGEDHGLFAFGVIQNDVGTLAELDDHSRNQVGVALYSDCHGSILCHHRLFAVVLLRVGF